MPAVIHFFRFCYKDIGMFCHEIPCPRFVTKTHCTHSFLYYLTLISCSSSSKSKSLLIAVVCPFSRMDCAALNWANFIGMAELRSAVNQESYDRRSTIVTS